MAVVAIVVVALLTSSSASPGPSERAGPQAAAASLVGSAGGVATTSVGPQAAGTSRASVSSTRTALATLPPLTPIGCHGLDPAPCSAIVTAAVGRLPATAPPVISVGAWGSLLCGDGRDCPASRFAGYHPLGSAVVSFGPDRLAAWVNVAAPDPGGVCPCGVIAWIIRWGS
jgi:hypothetical protein